MIGAEASAAVAPYWKKLCAFGSGDAEWHPYWEKDCPVRPETEHVYCSVYEKNGKLLAAVSSFNEETDTVLLRIPEGAALGEIVPGIASAERDGCILRLNMKAFRPELIELVFS